MARNVGKVQVNLSIDPILKDEFFELCKLEGISVTDAVSSWMQASINAKKIIAQPRTIKVGSDGSLPQEIQDVIDAKFKDEMASLKSEVATIKKAINTQTELLKT